MKLLLLSNSTNFGESYLEYPKTYIKRFLGPNIKDVLFIPYAAITISYDEYFNLVKKNFNEIGYQVESIHHFANLKQAVNQCNTIVIGGGNTFKLLKEIQDKQIIDLIRDIVKNKKVPYIGWSAGANMACPTIKTTNDMPVVEPNSFKALNFIPFQINPHYHELRHKDHGGETREQRIFEFIEANQEIYVAGLREGTMFHVEHNAIKLIGDKSVKIFKYGNDPKEYSGEDKLDFLLRKD